MATELQQEPKTSPFAAALDKAFATVPKDDVLEKTTTEKPAQAKETEKVEKPKEEKAAKIENERKVPEQLFKKQDVPEKKVETESKSEIDAIIEPTFKDEKGKAGWTALREKAKSFEQKATELEAEIAAHEAKGKDAEALQARLDALEKEKAEMSDLVSRARVEIHPEFRKRYIDDRANLVTRAQKIIEESGGDAKLIETALNLQGKARVEALREVAGDLDNFQSGRLGRVIDELTTLDEEKNAKLANSDNYHKELQKQESENLRKQQSEYQQTASKAFDSTATKLGDELEVLRKVEGLDWWNEQREVILKDARNFYEKNDDLSAAAKVSIQSHAAPIYRDLFLKERDAHNVSTKKITELEKELKGIYDKNPSVTGRKSSGDNGEKKGRFFSVLQSAVTGE